MKKKELEIATTTYTDKKYTKKDMLNYGNIFIFVCTLEVQWFLMTILN